MSSKEYKHLVQIYYEDTDHSGFVYYANYLKYFERAREHALGTATLVHLWETHKMGFNVYKVEVTYHEGCIFGEALEVRSTFTLSSDYRLTCYQNIWKPATNKLAVKGLVEMVLLDQNKKLTKINPTDLKLFEGE
ncbi:thioesterase family protein [Deltaproteobacteria bacterium TL4]